MKIAHEIHDELGQQLTGLKMDMAWLKRRLKPAEDVLIDNKFDDAIMLIEATIRSIRRIVTELRPSVIDDLGLNAALEWQSNDFAGRAGIKIKYKNTFDDLNADSTISIGLFRILQESLTNIAKHAKAKKVIVDISKEKDILQLTVEDNGIGFDTGIKETGLSFGLLGIKERTYMMKGDCSIQSQPGKGTKITVRIPVC